LAKEKIFDKGDQLIEKEGKKKFRVDMKKSERVVITQSARDLIAFSIIL